MDSIKIKPFEDNDDNYSLLYGWCSREHVYRWFEQRKLNSNEITEKYKKKLFEKEQSLFLISSYVNITDMIH